MALGAWDWFFVVLYLLFALAIGLRYRRRAGKGTEEFFVSGRSLPWWLAGTSMVATTFAADTPLAVTELVANRGIAGNWLWWSQALSGLLTAFLFAALWRRAGVLTDVELIEMRYAGRPAAALRAFRAAYLALPVNCIVMGWVNLAMAKVLSVTLGIDPWLGVWICFGLTVFYTFLSGFWGVVVTDFFQFAFAMGGCVLLAVFAVEHAGGLDVLLSQVAVLAPRGEQTLALLPRAGDPWLPLTTFLVYLGVNWWASWYPGAEPGGGGYVAQRLFATKNERHAVGAAVWFNVAHYAIRPWPWILVALASLVLFPGLEDPSLGFPMAMNALLPTPLRGILLAAFAAAYMSTISTQLNWGASYLVHDLYRRFLRRDASERHYVAVSRLSSIVLAALSFVVTQFMTTVSGAWQFLLALGAGTGAVYVLRWYWWRVNAWSEIAAMAAALALSLGLQKWGRLSAEEDFALLMVATAFGTIAVWLLVTFATKPVDRGTLVAFYRRIAPPVAGWGPIAAIAGPTAVPNLPLGRNLASWLLGCACVYAALFAVGEFLLGRPAAGAALLGGLVVGATVLVRLQR